MTFSVSLNCSPWNLRTSMCLLLKSTNSCFSSSYSRHIPEHIQPDTDPSSFRNKYIHTSKNRLIHIQEKTHPYERTTSYTGKDLEKNKEHINNVECELDLMSHIYFKVHFPLCYVVRCRTGWTFGLRIRAVLIWVSWIQSSSCIFLCFRSEKKRKRRNFKWHISKTATLRILGGGPGQINNKKK